MKTIKLNLLIAAWFVAILFVAMIATSCGTAHSCDAYSDSINNPENAEFIEEVAFNLNIAPQEVTQAMFNQRYSH